MNQWWFASENFTNGISSLRKTSETGSEKRYFKDAQNLSITTEHAWINVNKDSFFNIDNDLIVASKYQIGNRRIIDKVHFLKRNYPSNESIGPFFHPTIYATNDFKEASEAIILQVRVYDEDGLSTREIETLQKTLSSIGTSSSIAFPAFAPIAGLSTGIGNSLVTLVDNLNEHDRIIDGKIRLEINKPENQGYDHLQPGFIICFDEKIDGNTLFLGEDKQLYVDSEMKKLFIEKSYIVLRIRRAFLETPDYVINEKAATLLTEIENGKQGKAIQALSFVKETLDCYTKFKKLERVKELKVKDTLTDDEKELLEKLLGDTSISDFIPY